MAKTIREGEPQTDAENRKHFRNLAKTIQHQISASGQAEADIITVVYPVSMEKRQNLLAKYYAEKTAQELAIADPGHRYEVCHELFTMTHADRTHSKLAGFEKRVRCASPTLFKRGDTRRRFVVVDDTIAAGSTVAEMVSFIEHYGGRIVGFAAGLAGFNALQPNIHARNKFAEKLGRPEKPFDVTCFRKELKDPTLQRLQAIAFPDNGGFYLDLPQETRRAMAESALHHVGLSVEALTGVEMLTLSNDFTQPHWAERMIVNLEQSPGVPELTHKQKHFLDTYQSSQTFSRV